MPARKAPRLSYGEYFVPGPKGNTAVWTARRDLMRAVKRVYPSMLQRLSADVFPVYRALTESGFDLDAILWNDRLSPFTELGTLNLRLLSFS